MYLGRPVNNVRRALSSDPCVTEYFATIDAEYKLMNRGGHADQHGEVKLKESQADEYYSIQTQRAALLPQVLRLVSLVGAYTPCPCNSSKKVKWCHGVNNVGQLYGQEGRQPSHNVRFTPYRASRDKSFM